jgi:hydrogenase maturation protease
VSTLIVGIGNRERGDDAVGPAVLDALSADPPPGARMFESRGDALQLIDELHGAGLVVIVDAMVSGGAPGSIERFDVTQSGIPTRLEHLASTHMFSLAQGLELAQSLGRMPERLIVYGIEAAKFEPGSAPGPEVQGAVATVAARIREEIPCTKLP